MPAQHRGISDPLQGESSNYYTMACSFIQNYPTFFFEELLLIFICHLQISRVDLKIFPIPFDVTKQKGCLHIYSIVATVQNSSLKHTFIYILHLSPHAIYNLKA